jgi:drug/metabolite transporter (DMT)-like permease
LTKSIASRGDLFILGLTILVWGYNWVPLKILAVSVDPWWVAAIRVAVGSLTVFALLLFTRRDASIPRNPMFIVVGLTQIGGLVIFSTLALHFGGVATEIVLIFTMPLWSALFARLILGETMTRARLGWLLFATFGILVVASGLHRADNLSAACATAAGISWGLGNVLQRRAAVSGDLTRIVAWEQLVCAVPLAVLDALFGGPLPQPRGDVLAAFIFASVIGSGFAWAWWTRTLAVFQPNTVALGSFAIPVLGTLAAWIQLGAAPAPRTAIGLGIVIAGLVGSVVAANAGKHVPATQLPCPNTSAVRS